MQNVMIGIFAHPDDESFGPSGTLLRLASEGWDIHLICLTDGDAGVSIDNVADLGAVRHAEWQKSVNILGAASTHALHYPDATLNAIDFDQLTNSVRQIVDNILIGYQSPRLSLMTFEPNGLTNHPDHMVASRLATKLAGDSANVWYFCLDESQAQLNNTTLYEPCARDQQYITDRFDITPWLDAKHQMIDCHVSQRTDAEFIKKLGHTIENFHVKHL